MSEGAIDDCVFCERRPGVFRRGLCRSCYRKCTECGLPLPPERPPGPAPMPVDELRDSRLTLWLATWSTEARVALARALAKVLP